METLFLKLLNMSIAASWLVLAILFLRVFLRKAPKTIRCALWGLVGIRLICPFSFESIFSLIPSAETIPQEIVYAQEPAIQSGISFLNQAVNPVISQSLAPKGFGSVNPMQIALYIASWLWIAGIIGMLVYAAISYLGVRRKVSASVPVSESTCHACHTESLYHKIKGSHSAQNLLWLCDYIDSPFILGILRPRIYLPSTLDTTQITHVIAHETAHLKRYDHIWKPLGFALLTVYWFNPVMWFAYILLCRDIELACDEMVIREMDTEAKKSYSKALLSCSIPSHKIAACPLAFGETGVKSRIKAVLQYKKPALLLTAAAVIVCIITAVCFLTNPKQTDSPQNTAQPDTLEARLAPEKWTKKDYLHYIYADTEWMWAPSLTLHPATSTFIFSDSPVSSYLGVGQYTSTDNTLTLQTDDGLYHYTFHAEGTSLIFDAANSSTIRYFVKPSSIEREQQITVPDGGAFIPESDVYYTE